MNQNRFLIFSIFFFFILLNENLRAEDFSRSNCYRERFQKASPPQRERDKGGPKGGKSGARKKKIDNFKLISGDGPFLPIISLENNSLIATSKSSSHTEMLWGFTDWGSSDLSEIWLSNRNGQTLDSKIQTELIAQIGWFGEDDILVFPDLIGIHDRSIGQAIPFSEQTASFSDHRQRVSVLSDWQIAGIYSREISMGLVDSADEIAITIAEVANSVLVLGALSYNPLILFIDQPAIPQIDTSKPWYRSPYLTSLTPETFNEAAHNLSDNLFDFYIDRRSGGLIGKAVKHFKGPALKFIKRFIRRFFPVRLGSFPQSALRNILIPILSDENIKKTAEIIRETIEASGNHLPRRRKGKIALQAAQDLTDRVRARGPQVLGDSDKSFRRAIESQTRRAIAKDDRKYFSKLAGKIKQPEAESFFAAVAGKGTYSGTGSYDLGKRALQHKAKETAGGRPTEAALAAQALLDGTIPAFPSSADLASHPFGKGALKEARNFGKAYLYIQSPSHAPRIGTRDRALLSAIEPD